ncbi:hypothetical protein WJX72_002010 [[Myrmecia] bisecta]|uniref:PPM-type phosphatase domain-containing protein n=1 Tax=[Myrmecia] bisecta TaxID=41462 RepID=A0AAW1P8W4_9CHLO
MGAAKAYQGSSKPFLKFAQSQSSLKHEDVILVLPNNVFPNPKLPGQGPTATVREVAGVAIDLASDLVTAKQQQATEVNCGQVDIHVGSTVYGLFCILDGHNGVTAANHVANSLQEVLTARLPAGEPPLESDGELYRSWRGHLQKALVGALSDLHLSFACLGLAAGCTATIILQCGWLVTVANLGDSRAVLDTGFETRQLTVDHRVATHQGERKRLESSGALIAPVDLSGTGPAQGPQAGGFGPLRVWPGGLCLSRAIGDFDVGEVIIPCPHICQVRVPETGGRVLVASDGVWDAFDKMGRVARMARGWATEVAPDRILGAIKRAYGGLRDDSSVVILDLLPPGQDFPSVARSTRKSMKPGCLSCFAPPPPAPGTDGNEAPQMEVLVDVDVAALLGLMPGVSVPRPEWCDDDFKVAMASAQAEAARIWRKANSMRRLGRSPSRDDLQSIFQPFGIAAPFPPSPKAVAVAAGGPDRPSQPSPIDRDPSVKVGASDTPAAKAALEEARRAALESGQNASGRFGRSTTTDQGFSGRFGKYHGNGGGSGSGGMKPSTSSGALSKLPTITAGEALDTSADSQQLVPSASHEDMVAGVEVGASQRFGDAIATEERYAAKFGHYKASSRMQWEAERSASPDPAAAGESKPERAKRRSIEFADWFKRHASLGRPGSPSPADRRLSLDRAQLTDGAATTSGNPNYPASSTPADERGPGRRRPMRSLDDISTRLRDQDMSMARRVQDSRTAGGDSRGSQSLRGASSDVRSSTAGSVSGSAVVQETSAQPATQPLGQPAAGGTPLQRSAGQTGVRSGSGTPSSSQYGTPDGSPRSHMSSASTLSRYASALNSRQRWSLMTRHMLQAPSPSRD